MRGGWLVCGRRALGGVSVSEGMRVWTNLDEGWVEHVEFFMSEV